MKVEASDKSNRGAARHGGKEAGVEAMSPRTETGDEAGDVDELVPHHEVPVSASQVKSGVVLRKSRPLPGDGAKRRRPAVGGLPRRGERSEANLSATRRPARERAPAQHRHWQQSRGADSLVQAALNNAWLQVQGVPDMRAKWIAGHYGDGGVAA